MLKNFLKSAVYIFSLAILSIVGSFAINSAIAAWTSPAQDPPNGNVSNPTVWLDGGTNVYLSTLTDYVGIGTQNPNKQLHIKTASGNAELDIQSASQNYWAIYHDDTTEQLRFWNADFAGDIGAGAGNAFVIDNDGTILVKTPIDGDSDNAIATKGYVDAAAGGGGDATLANQEAMMGSSYDVNSDSLRSLSEDIGSPSDSANMTTSLFAGLGYIWQNRSSFGLQGTPQGTYFFNGGSPRYCKKQVVDSGGLSTISNINQGLTCDNSKTCSNGLCGGTGGTYLTYSGSARTEEDCLNYGGAIFNTGSGTACRLTGSSCPSGWSQAANWQKYSVSSFEGDACGYKTGSAPTSFSNTQSVKKTAGTVYYYDPSLDVCPQSEPSQWLVAGREDWGTFDTYYSPYRVINTYNVSVNRVEIGCY